MISCVVIGGGKSGMLVSEDMIKRMKGGWVVVDVGIEEGGGVESWDDWRSDENGRFVKDGVSD